MGAAWSGFSRRHGGEVVAVLGADAVDGVVLDIDAVRACVAVGKTVAVLGTGLAVAAGGTRGRQRSAGRGDGVRAFVRVKAFDHQRVRARREHHLHHGLAVLTARIVNIGDLNLAGLEVVAGVKPEPGVKPGSLASRERVRHVLGDRDGVPVLAGHRADGVRRALGGAVHGAVAGELAARRARRVGGVDLCGRGGEGVAVIGAGAVDGVVHDIDAVRAFVAVGITVAVLGTGRAVIVGAAWSGFSRRHGGEIVAVLGADAVDGVVLDIEVVV